MNGVDELPDLAGRWALHGVTLAPDGAPLYEWDGALIIGAKGNGFSAMVETEGMKTSRACSFAEKITRQADGRWHLRYAYEADPDHPATEGHTFFGLSQITFAPDLQSGEGTSCNYNGRYVVIQLGIKRLD